MTSVNIISPDNKASNFNVRFREPITIEKDSKVYLNYATLKRSNNFEFKEVQELTLESSVIIPTHKYDVTDELNELSIAEPIITRNFNSDSNKLTPFELEHRINESLDRLCIDQLTYYKSYLNSDNDMAGDTDTKMKVGLELREFDTVFADDNIDFPAPPANGYGQATTVNNFYAKNTANAANPFYDNYSVTQNPLWTFQNGSESLKYSGFYKRIKFKQDDTMDNLLGKASIAFFSKSMMDEPNAFKGWDEKTRGVNPTNNTTYLNPALFESPLGPQLQTTNTAEEKADGILGGFLTIELDSSNLTTTDLNIFIARNAANEKPLNWENMDEDIDHMYHIRNVDISSYIDTSVDILDVAVIFYMNVEDREQETGKDEFSDTYDFNKQDFRLNYKVMVKATTDDDSEYKTVFKSETKDDNDDTDNDFPLEFFIGLDPNEVFPDPPFPAPPATQLTFNERVARIKSQTGFSIITSFTHQNEELKTEFTPFRYRAAGFEDKPFSYLLSYDLNFTKETQKALNMPSSQTDLMYPNSTSNNPLYNCIFQYDNFRTVFGSKSYDIYIGNLNINNYKNVEDAGKGGFKKAILATVPLPFGSTQTTTESYDGSIIGLYQPNNPIKLDLENQKISINNLDIELKNTEDDTPADEVTKLNFNFIIEK